MSKSLVEEDFRWAAQAIGCDVRAVKAVCKVEAPRGGFLASGEPAILFERHIFSRLTNRRYDNTAPDLSNKTPGGYSGGQAEHKRLARAAALDRNAALKAASWGKFQILGSNFKQAGFGSLQEFINAMYVSERTQLEAFVSFIKADLRLVAALRNRDWKTFARIYNGPNYAINKYDTKLATAYMEA